MTMCDNKELLVGYLYDDVTTEERRTFEAHLASCAGCQHEVAALRSTRDHLASWSPPDAELGFRIVRQTVEPPAKVVPFRSRWMPAFGLAAAAVLVLAAATALANIEVRYDNNGFVVRTGWAGGEVPAPTLAQAPAAPAVSGVQAQPVAAKMRSDFELVEQRLRALEEAIAAQPATSVARMSDAEMLRQVRALVREAEARQQGAVAERLLQVMQDLERQRRTDLAMLQQGNAQFQGLTNAALASINQTLRVNQLEK
jgi:hypothetical protein